MDKLLSLISKMKGEVKKMKFQEASKTLKEIHKLLDTYKYAC